MLELVSSNQEDEIPKFTSIDDKNTLIIQDFSDKAGINTNLIRNFLNINDWNISTSQKIILINWYLDALKLNTTWFYSDIQDSTIKTLTDFHKVLEIDYIREKINSSGPNNWSREPLYYHSLIKVFIKMERETKMLESLGLRKDLPFDSFF